MSTLKYFEWTNFCETYFRKAKKRQLFASFIFAICVFLNLFFAFLTQFCAFLGIIVRFCAFYFREKGQIRENREIFSAQNIVYLK